jgi:hypothetical protein
MTKKTKTAAAAAVKPLLDLLDFKGPSKTLLARLTTVLRSGLQIRLRTSEFSKWFVLTGSA